MTEAQRPPGEPTTPDTPNWSVGEQEDLYRAQAPLPPARRTWNPGPDPGYEMPPYQPLTDTPPSAAYYPPPLGLQVVPPAPTNGMAVASLVFGILGWVMVPVLAPVLAIIFGHVARAQIRATGQGGGGMAVAGLILGYVNLALAVIALGVLIILVVIAAVATSALSG